MASATTSSAPPSAYISAVSISVMPRSRPSRSAAASARRSAPRSPMCQVPWPERRHLRPVRQSHARHSAILRHRPMIAAMRRTATLLAAALLSLSPLPAAAQPVDDSIGTWRLSCATDRMTDRSACQMLHARPVERSEPGPARPRAGGGGARRPAGAGRHRAQPDVGGRGARAAGAVRHGAAPLPAQPPVRDALRPRRPLPGLRPAPGGPGARRGGAAGRRARAGPDAGAGRHQRRAGGAAARPHRRGARPPAPGSAARLAGAAEPPAFDGRDMLQRLFRMFGQ